MKTRKIYKLTVGIPVLIILCLIGGNLYFNSIFYNTTIQNIYKNGHPVLSYYLNFNDAELAQLEGNYFFGAVYDLPKAKNAYKLALKLNPKLNLAHYALGRIYFVESNYYQALNEFNAELSQNPQNTRTYYMRGLVYTYRGERGDILLAERDFKLFISAMPHEWGGYNDLAYVLALQGKYSESEAIIKEGMKQVPKAEDVPWLWNSLGVAQLNELYYAQAEASFEKALMLAMKLTPEEWHKAYSGNSPDSIYPSIAAFQEAIKNNIATAKKGLTL